MSDICVCGNDICGYCPGTQNCNAAKLRAIERSQPKISHNYLPSQFENVDEIISDIRDVVRRADFTLGREVASFERKFAALVGVKHAIGVGNGTDAIFLALKALGVSGGSVITTPYSFYATPAMIHHAGATPVFVDVDRDFNIDPDKIEAAITPDTVGIVPVHWAGKACRMDDILDIARRHGLWVMEDCAHAKNSVYRGRKCGSFGDMGTFSLHPLKNVNVWGDGGVIVTNDDARAEWLRKARNHGMSDRDHCEFWGWNSRLDTIQAVVAMHVMSHVYTITAQRRYNAMYLNNALRDVEGLALPFDTEDTEQNYYLYSMHAQRRDDLQRFLIANGVDAKVHYPIPLHRQMAAGVQKNDFPMADWCAETTLSLPVHEFITEDDMDRMAGLVHQFYSTAK